MKLDQLLGFQWDSGNLEKNWLKHRITNLEAEQVFFNKPLVISEDSKHSSQKEQRFVVLGQTHQQKLLTIVFTTRHKYIRIISARPMSSKERTFYETTT